MESRRIFLNPALRSPWESRAPRTFKTKKLNKVVNDENNNVRLPRLTKYMFRPDFQYHNIGFHLHSGNFHTFYQQTKRMLEENQRIKQLNDAMLSRNPHLVIPKVIRPNNHQRVLSEIDVTRPANSEQIEVIDITGDGDSLPSKTPFPVRISPMRGAQPNQKKCSPTNVPLKVCIMNGDLKQGRSQTSTPVFEESQLVRKQKVSIGKQHHKGFVRIKPKANLLQMPNSCDKGCKSENTTRPAVGVVIIRKNAEYISRLL